MEKAARSVYTTGNEVQYTGSENFFISDYLFAALLRYTN